MKQNDSPPAFPGWLVGRLAGWFSARLFGLVRFSVFSFFLSLFLSLGFAFLFLLLFFLRLFFHFKYDLPFVYSPPPPSPISVVLFFSLGTSLTTEEWIVLVHLLLLESFCFSSSAPLFLSLFLCIYLCVCACASICAVWFARLGMDSTLQLLSNDQSEYVCFVCVVSLAVRIQTKR